MKKFIPILMACMASLLLGTFMVSGIEFASGKNIPDALALIGPALTMAGGLLQPTAFTGQLFCIPVASQLFNAACEPNAPGMAVIGYFCKHGDILTWPTVAASPTTPEDYVTYTGNFVMASTKQWYELYNTEDTPMVTDEAQGEKDSKSFKNIFAGFIPGAGATRRAWAYAMLNESVVFARKTRNGDVLVVGTKDVPAKVETLSISTGDTPTSRSGITFQFSCSTGTPSMVYPGTIPLTPAP